MDEPLINEIHIENRLMSSIRRLAVRHWGDASEAAVLRETEIALELLLVWLDRVEGSEKEIEEPLTTWEFPASSVGNENGNRIRRWLFRGR
jgi:hypothetical protein